MRKCDLYTGATRVRKGLEQVEFVWNEAADQWNDIVSHKFREQHIDPLAPDIKMALAAIARMQTVLDQACRELEE